MSEVAEDSLLGGSKNEAAVLPRTVLRVLLVCGMFLMHPTERDSVLNWQDKLLNFNQK